VWFLKIRVSILPPQRFIGNSEGRGVLKAKLFKGMYLSLNWNFQMGGGSNQEKPSMGGVWIISGTTPYEFLL